MFVFGKKSAQVAGVVIPVGQIAIGLLCSANPWLWFKCFLELFLWICVSIHGATIFVDVVYSAVFPKIQAQRVDIPKRRLAEFAETTRAFFCFAGFAAWTRYLYVLGEPTALVFTLKEAQPSHPDNVALYVFKLILVTLAVDAYMYLKHRILHLKPFFAFHANHHSFKDPSPFAGFAIHPVECVVTFGPVLMLCIPSAPVWAHAYAIWVVLFVLLNLYLHCGVTCELLEMLAAPLFINSSLFHNAHHEFAVTNFGELLYLWDYFLDSGFHRSPFSYGRHTNSKKPASETVVARTGVKVLH